MDVNELLQRYAVGKRDFAWADLQGADLAGSNLAQSNLNRANLTGANLKQANLSQANLTKANFSNVDLTGANLTGATCRKANFTGAILAGAILEDVDWTGATLPDGSMFEAIAAAEPETDTQLEDAAVISSEAARKETPELVATPALSTPARPRQTTLKEFQADLPWPSLLLLGVGYCCFGFLIGMHPGAGLAWVIAWLGSIAWLFEESLTWFAPLVGAIAVMAATGVSVVLLAVCGVVTFTLLVMLRFLGWSWRAAVKDSLWVGAIGAVAITTASWLFADNEGTGAILVSGKFPFAILLLLGVSGAGLGAVAWGQMLGTGYSRKQTAWTFGGTTALGLLGGCLLALPLRG
ncbi:pentapeptide repeat-containing protein [Trichocoleus sp. FACHB-591]|uniref:pentapeptide repeat-containing protein n=1 Tax=Trichocoleus sp. FACHB-591 TaxID=2692872 RepID=UPI001689B7F1|nr:pentapeptide repeat-containing protein [Trichocoleus sp. FACHB-591]MBD2094895.1 pentapeptide repeat-containing protein [Trichocoleus sp. FACHB-591]